MLHIICLFLPMIVDECLSSLNKGKCRLGCGGFAQNFASNDPFS
jgi:hypothetical protein